MKITDNMQRLFQYIWDGVSRIFTPSDDEYPDSGVQPFEGDPFDEKRDSI